MQPNKFSPEDFLTRAEKIKQMEFPISDDSRVIVLPNNEVLASLPHRLGPGVPVQLLQARVLEELRGQTYV